MISKLKESYLKKILFLFLDVLLFLYIIKECKLIGFCFSLIALISPLFFGYIISWLLKPIMLKFNKHFNTIISTIITYVLLSVIIGLMGYFTIPIIIKEVKNLIPNIVDFYNNLPVNIKDSINISEIASKMLIMVNNCTNNIKIIGLNIFYSLFISYFYLISHKEVSKFISKYIPGVLANDISLNLKAFVRGTIIDTVVLFIMTLISFYLIKMPYSLLFAIIISLTNIIPYIGPYIGGIPAVLVAFSISNRVGIIVLILIIVLQFIESTFIHPIIMSKSLNISALYIMISLIICSYFFGLIGMLISTPIVSVIKCCYDYYKANKKKLKIVPRK